MLLLLVVERVFICNEFGEHDTDFVRVVSVEFVSHEAHVNFDANLIGWVNACRSNGEDDKHRHTAYVIA